MTFDEKFCSKKRGKKKEERKKSFLFQNETTEPKTSLNHIFCKELFLPYVLPYILPY
jgi:hypothetical protein